VQNLPDVSAARLPETYERAKTALSECSKVDECQEWADKAEALASYAKQSKDESLRKMADRIQARAVRRAGELYRQFSQGKGGDRKSDEYQSAGDHTSIESARKMAGQSRHQAYQAIRVANVPEDDFEKQTESDTPPTVTKLAEQGKKTLVDLDGIDPSLYAKATKVKGAVKRMAEMCESNDPRKIAKGFKPHEIEGIKKNVSAIDAWLDLFVTNLE